MQNQKEKEKTQMRFELLLENAVSREESVFIRALKAVHQKLNNDQKGKGFSFWSVIDLNASLGRQQKSVVNFIDNTHQVAIYRFTGEGNFVEDHQRAIQFRDLECRYAIDLRSGLTVSLNQSMKVLSRGFLPSAKKKSPSQIMMCA